MRTPAARLWPAALLAPALLVPQPAASAGDEMSYRTPPQVLVDLLDAPPTPLTVVDPRQEWLLLMELPSMPPVAELAERELRLAGLRIRPRVSGPSRSFYVTSLKLQRIADGGERAITGLPVEARLENVRWSPDGSRLSFTHTGQQGIELWAAEVATGRARRLGDVRLNLVTGIEPAWLGDSSGLVAALVPNGRGAEPPAPEVPAGPVIQEVTGTTAAARTFQDLLKNPHDEALFEHYATSQLARIGLDGAVTPLGAPGILWSLDPSPDGRWLLVETLHRPYSYLVPVFRFPRRIEVLDLAGRPVRLVADLPLQEAVPITFGSVPTGPRGVEWRPDEPATLVWAEALDGGDAGREAAERDRLLRLAAPFSGKPEAIATLALRYAGAVWGDDLALLYESWWKTRTIRTWILREGSGGKNAKPELLFDRSFEDRYSDPGRPQTTINTFGRQVLRTADGGRTLYMVGEGASPEGDRPFLDALDLTAKTTRRLFHSEAPYYERPVQLLADGSLLVRRESVEEPPNYFVRDLASGDLRRVTSFPHPTPQLAGIKKELVRYDRADGVKLTGTLYTPAGWTPADGPLPTLVWAYPQEFKSAEAAGQVTDSPYRFARVGWWSPLPWLTQGYAVLDDPTMPIVGEGEAEPNDSYVQQLVASAEAAVGELVRRGVADPNRIAIGGHSYGAFTAANLLAHTDLFAAGIARSGAYNRTLTPFGFQSEDRTLWQAPEIYSAMSPFMHADKIDEPLLLIHGEADNNSGTFPMQSERLFNALKGHGATARLVLLPHESHGYQARESILHTFWETGEWLEKYVKNGGERKTKVPEEVPKPAPLP